MLHSEPRIFMKFSKGQKMRFKCNVCNSTKNVKLIHAKKSFQKTSSHSGMRGVDTFILQYRVGKHHHGTNQCSGSDKIQSKKYDGLLDSEF